MIDRFIRQLERFVPLSPAEKLALREGCTSVQRFAPRHDLVREHETPTGISLMHAGFACRYSTLPDNRRQILGYLVPGDICGLAGCVLGRVGHAVATLSAVELTHVSLASLLELLEESPRLSRALWGITLVDEATSRQWLLNVGHRNALERTAHLLCELFARLHAVGLTQQNACELPITQSDLADALALSPVHVNRTLMELRRLKLITLQHQQLTIHDLEALQSLAGFSPGYLQLGDACPFPARPRSTVARIPPQSELASPV